jgi:uncharacterized phiE125 gp8 family phage protein
MLTIEPLTAGADALDAAKTYARIDTDTDDATIAALTGAAMAQAEAYIGELTIERGCQEVLDAGCVWTKFGARPVASITEVRRASDNALLAPTEYETDIATDGSGRVRLTGSSPQRVRVAYRAGRFASWGTVAEPVRLGIVRLAAHWLSGRDLAEAEALPRFVTDHWRTARRLVLS